MNVIIRNWRSVEDGENTMSRPTAYTICLPSCPDLEERTILHSDLVRDSPCGWCGKKSTCRIRYYIDSTFTDAFVIAACENHFKELKEDLHQFGGNLEAIHFFNKGNDFE